MNEFLSSSFLFISQISSLLIRGNPRCKLNNFKRSENIERRIATTGDAHLQGGQ